MLGLGEMEADEPKGGETWRLQTQQTPATKKKHIFHSPTSCQVVAAKSVLHRCNQCIWKGRTFIFKSKLLRFCFHTFKRFQPAWHVVIFHTDCCQLQQSAGSLVHLFSTKLMAATSSHAPTSHSHFSLKTSGCVWGLWLQTARWDALLWTLRFNCDVFVTLLFSKKENLLDGVDLR